MKAAIPAPNMEQLEQQQRREAWLARADAAPLPPRAELPLEDYEKRLMEEDSAASRSRRRP